MTRRRLGSALAVTILAAPVAACGSTGDVAVWDLGPGQRLGPSSTTFIALVSRFGCNSGVTGEVLAPEVRLEEAEVVVKFRVMPETRGPADCPSNNQVSYEVDLGEPLGDRALVDGECLPGGAAVNTNDCVTGATRFRP